MWEVGRGEGVVTWKMKLLQLPGSMAEGGREVGYIDKKKKSVRTIGVQ